ncbi:MAG: phosphotransferase [Halioglobus sp.]
MADFPTSADQVTAEHINAYLDAAGCLGGARVTDVESTIIGTGKMGDNARLVLHYEGATNSAPDSLIGKFPASDETARSIAGAQGAYYNEVMFYREIAPHTTMQVPRIYGSELSEDRMDFILLMEDMAPAEPGNNLVGASREQAELALAEAAKLAAAFYGDETLGERDYVLTATRDDGGEFGAALMQQSWPGFVDRFGHGMTPEMIRFGERYVEHHAHFATRFQGKKTIAHGDFRSENILFGPQGATVVDWQTTNESSALTDAAYYLGGSVAVEDRRAWERDLIEHYRVILDRAGVSLESKDCWEQYREFAMHGILITVLGASFSTPDERSDKMFLSMVQGHLQHCIDVGAEEFLPA